MSVFTASASANGEAYTKENVLVTASSSATAESEISQQDALEKATILAQQLANETAIYDANVINEATEIATSNIDYNTKQIDSPPNIVFYNTTDANQVYLTETFLIGGNSTSALQTWNGSIFSDSALTHEIGTWASTSTTYNVTNPDPHAIYDKSGSKTYYLPQGTLTILTITPVTKNSQGHFVNIPGIEYYPIASATGIYLNATGIIKVESENITKTRKVSVYLN